MSRQYRDAEYLRERYVEAGRSAKSIARECGVTSSTISRWLDRHGIEREPRYQDEEWLRTQYVEKAKTQERIADECDVGTTTICHWLGRHGITEGESLERATCATCGSAFRYYPSVRDGDYCSNECAREPDKRQVTVDCKGCDSEFRRRASLDTEYCSMSCWSEDYDGISGFWYGSHWQKRRLEALVRDGYECSECGMSNEEHKQRCGRELEVHHRVPVRLFDSWDKSVEAAHSLKNLKTVCRTHHPDAPGTVEDLAGKDSDNGE